MYKSLSLGDWHEDRVCIYDDDTDEAIGWLSQAQGRELPRDLLNLVRAAPELLRELKFAVTVLRDNHIPRGLAAALLAIAKAEGRGSE